MKVIIVLLLAFTIQNVQAQQTSFQTSNQCQVNVNSSQVPNFRRNLFRATVLINFRTFNGEISGSCSGTLLNTNRGDWEVEDLKSQK